MTAAEGTRTPERYFSAGPKCSDLSPDPDVRADVAAAVCTDVFGLGG